VQGSQQIWVAALWYWGNSLNGKTVDYIPPWWIVLFLWPLAIMSLVFAYLILYGLPGEFFDLCLFQRATKRFRRILPPDAAQGAKFLEDFVPSKISTLVSYAPQIFFYRLK
jgi:hypothetical protein